MPSTYSPLLRLELMAVGEKTNTWGTITNTNLGTLLEKGIAGAVTVDMTSSNVTLTALSGSDDQARCAILLLTGSPGVSRNIVAPSTSKAYIVYNGSNGAAVIKGAATTGVSLGIGEYAFIAWNGSDFVRIGVSPVSPAFTGTPTAPTAAVDTNSTQVATTSYVVNQGYAKLGGAGTSGTWPISITGDANTLDGIDSTGFFRNNYVGSVAIANVDADRASGWYELDHGGYTDLLFDATFTTSTVRRVQMIFTYGDLMYIRAARDSSTQWDGAAWNANQVLATNVLHPVNGVGASGTWPISITGSAANATSGAYTPTVTAGSGITGTPTATNAQWTRIGNVVTVFGRFEATLTSPNVAAGNLYLSLPVASNLGSTTDLNGTGSVYVLATISGSILITGDVASDRAFVTFTLNGAGALTHGYSFSYTVI